MNNLVKTPYPPLMIRRSSVLPTLLLSLLVFLPLRSPCLAGTDLVYLTQEHCDLQLLYQAQETNALSLVIDDDDHGRSYEPEEAVLVVVETAQYTLPAGTPFGPEGAPIWILPQHHQEGILFLGLSTATIAPDLLNGPLSLRLRSVEAPGRFFLWQAAGTGNLDVKMNSADGIGAEDLVLPQAGGHEHFNYGFSTTGVYRVTFQAEAVLRANSTTVTSPETTLVFHVQPLPPASPYETWQARHFPINARAAVTGPSADPDQDGFANLLEYAYGWDPLQGQNLRELEGRIVEVEGQRFGGIRYLRAKTATDLRFQVLAADQLDHPSWAPVTGVEQVVDLGEQEAVTVRETRPLAAATTRIYRLQIMP